MPPGIGDQTDLAEGLNETRRTCRQHQVAGQRNVRASPGRHAVDRADHRQRQVAQLADQRVVELLDRLAQIRHGAARCDIAVAEVLPGAEAATFTGQQQDAHVGVLPDLFQRFFHFAMHLCVEAVELVRPIEAEQGDAGLDGKQDVFEVHGLGALLEVVRIRYRWPDYCPVKVGVRFPERPGCLRRGRGYRPAR